MRKSPCLKQHLTKKSFAPNKEKMLFFAAEHTMLFAIANYRLYAGK